MTTNPQDREALTSEECDRWFRDPGDLAVWEDIASWFHRDTGHLRPGKDKPIGFHECPEDEPDCCMDAWLLWSQDMRDKAVRGLFAERNALRTANQEQAAEISQWRKDWLLMLRTIAAFNSDWADATDSDLCEEFDPWEELRRVDKRIRALEASLAEADEALVWWWGYEAGMIPEHVERACDEAEARQAARKGGDDGNM